MNCRPRLCFLILATLGTRLHAGVATCGTCHKAQATVTSMTRALETVQQCVILGNNPKLEFHDGNYAYAITREGDRSIYTVTDGKETIIVPLGWAFGLGEAGQTYVFEREGKYYESRVSFYKDIGKLDLTMGAQNRKPENLQEAAGRYMSEREAGNCFGCHATGAVVKGALHLETMVPGLQCDRCHAGAEAHAADVRVRPAKLSKLSSEEMSTFCGQCHRTWADIASNGPQGINNVRFQPYRLANSRCFDTADPRISCVACHNPHQPVPTSVSAYDAKCESCHAAPAKTCPVAAKDCTTCHMPKFALPGAHHSFTDHQIRIVRAGESYPN